MSLTLLIFMAADNDLEAFAEKDLHEMEKIGSGDHVNVVVQIDQRGDGSTGPAKRGLIQKNPDWKPFPRDCISEWQEIGETNTGDPSTLAQFLAWGISEFPADRYALIIWNHGNGWKPEFFPEQASKYLGAASSDIVKSPALQSHFSKVTKRTLFRGTAVRKFSTILDDAVEQDQASGFPVGELSAEDFVARAIGLDESSNNDALDCLELRDAIRVGLESGGLSQDAKLFVLGLDACLMAGIEVCYELCDLTEAIIGSEEIEPSTGWAYDQVISIFSSGETVGIPDVGDGIVSAYIESLRNYKVRLVTQSCISSMSVKDLCVSLDEVTSELSDAVSTKYLVIAKQEKHTLRFFDRDYIDLGGLVSSLSDIFSPGRYDEFQIGYGNCVLTSKFAFEKPGLSPTGMSIYFPTTPKIMEGYDQLSFSKDFGGWLAFLKSYHFLD